jgi:citrate synthase
MANPVKTAISRLYPDRILVRGYNLVEMAGRYSFGDTFYLLITGELPTGHEGDLLEAMMVMSVEHSLNAPSTHTARAVANCGVPLQSAVAAGISAIGEHHGGAGEACARLLQETLQESPDEDVKRMAAGLVAQFQAAGRRLPGFGHRFHDPDPRARRLLSLAQEWGIVGAHVALARAIEEALQASTGRSLPMNVDGAQAALLSDMGVDWHYAKSVFILGRSAGLVAHAVEEMTTGKPFRFIAPVQAEYIGPAERPLPSGTATIEAEEKNL